MMDLLFVYGTLRPGQRAYGLLAPHVHARSTVRATTPGYLLLMPPGYPGLIEAMPFGLPPGGLVMGELLRFHDLGPDERDALWRRLDDYEGQEYTRVLREVTAPDAGPISTYHAYCYVLVAEVAQAMFAASRLIPGGDFARAAAMNT